MPCIWWAETNDCENEINIMSDLVGTAGSFFSQLGSHGLCLMVRVLRSLDLIPAGRFGGVWWVAGLSVEEAVACLGVYSLR